MVRESLGGVSFASGGAMWVGGCCGAGGGGAGGGGRGWRLGEVGGLGEGLGGGWGCEFDNAAAGGFATLGLRVCGVVVDDFFNGGSEGLRKVADRGLGGWNCCDGCYR